MLMRGCKQEAAMQGSLTEDDHDQVRVPRTRAWQQSFRDHDSTSTERYLHTSAVYDRTSTVARINFFARVYTSGRGRTSVGGSPWLRILLGSTTRNSGNTDTRVLLLVDQEKKIGNHESSSRISFVRMDPSDLIKS
jgi:hypothetical protein